jgi:hypothetical protein
MNPNSESSIYFKNIRFHRVYPAGQLYSSCAMCKDGRVIFVFQDTSLDYDKRLLQGYVADVPTFCNTNDCVEEVSDAIYFPEHECKGNVFNVEEELYIVVSKKPYGLTDGIHGTYIYKSPSGNGGDWILHGTVFELNTLTHGGDQLGSGMEVPSIPYISEDGTWVLAHTTIRNYWYMIFWICEYDASVSTSSDGSSWNLSLQRQSWNSGNFNRQFGEFNGELYLNTDYNMAMNGCIVYKADTEGSSWTPSWYYNFYIPLTFWSDIEDKEGYLYSFYNGMLYRTKNDFTSSLPTQAANIDKGQADLGVKGWELVADLMLASDVTWGYDNRPVVQPLIFMDDYGVKQTKYIVCDGMYVSYGFQKVMCGSFTL